jgi:hypothetical protein
MKRELQNFLSNDILRVFIATKGRQERAMVCTLAEEMIPPKHRKPTVREGIDTMAVFDMEKECWRPINVDAIVGMERVERVTA